MGGSFVLGMIYNSYLVPNSVMTDEHFLRHLFSSTLLEALGLKDDSGVIYELINYRFSTGVFNLTPMDWEIARAMSNLWANFVIYGDPTSPEFPISIPDESVIPSQINLDPWPLWKGETDHQYLKIDQVPEVRHN